MKRRFRIKDTTEIIEANSMKQALLILVAPDGDFTYKNHWYTKSNRKSWAEFETSYGYSGIVQEVTER